MPNGHSSTNPATLYPSATRRSVGPLAIRILGVGALIEASYVLLRLVTQEIVPGTQSSSLRVFLLFALAQLASIFYFWLQWSFETYVLGKNNLIHQRGIVFRREDEYPYNNIQSITVRQGPIGRALHFGEVTLYIPTLGKALVFSEIPHPHHFVERIKQAMPFPDKSKLIIPSNDHDPNL